MSRAEKQQSTSDQWKEIRKCRLWMDDHLCQHCDCDEETARRLEVHHLKPVDAGGSDRLDNLITLCQRCHKHLHRQEPDGVKYPVSLLVGKELPDRLKRELPVNDESPDGGVFRKRVGWIVSADLPILEFMHAARDAYGQPAVQSPSTIAKNTGYSSEHIGNRCRGGLLNHDLLTRESRGYYRLTERGARVVQGEILPADLVEED